uniref:Biopolymer transport protein ExbD n=1 Tax=Candidatus Kentrum sp. DK TaxID=2126562 RepID=A0A450T6H1_9GAMM|nr:MAG: biopolymer transport protein ExbD [Candidatus Kentron sp. DK]VFJ67350.1 MAG: biopolymer transport protein ExbD [Candidatus Kentron sp. DK]
MNLRRARIREEPNVTLTPLIDVVFLLLIFFMVSTTFERNSELAIELPEAATEAKPSKEVTVEVSIDAEGRYYVDDRMLINKKRETIRRALTKASDIRRSLTKTSDDKFPPLILTADERTPYQSVVTFMDVARQLGFSQLRFATQLVEGP